jgi:FO synthase
MEAPIYRKGRARRGPTYRECVLMHAAARLVLHPLIPNIQASWVKMGPEGVGACLDAGINDLGGTLMNESISRAAGAAHGQEMTPAMMQTLIRTAGRRPRERTTLYATSTRVACEIPVNPDDEPESRRSLDPGVRREDASAVLSTNDQ